MTSDEQTLYFFAFRYALPRQSYALSLVSHLILERVNDFDDWKVALLERIVAQAV